MGNDEGGRQWWGFMEEEGVVCWASHFVRGSSIFSHAWSFSVMHSHLYSCMVVLIHVQSSSSVEQSWWMVSAGHSSCRLLGVVVSVGTHCLWVGSLLSASGGSSMGGHCYLGSGIAVHCLLWFEHHGGRSCGWWKFMRVVGMVWGFVWCGCLHDVGFAWVVGVCMGGGGSHGCGHSHRSGWWVLVIHWWQVIVVCGQGIIVVGGGLLCMGLSALSLCFVGRGLWCC